MASKVFQNATPCAERDAPLDGDEVEDDLLRREPAVPVLRAIERRDDEDGRAAGDVVSSSIELREVLLVVVAIELLEVALVGAVLKDDERRVAERQLLLPVRAVLVLPVDGHRGVRAEGVVDDSRPIALERDAEEAHGPAAHGPQGHPGLAVRRCARSERERPSRALASRSAPGGAPRTLTSTFPPPGCSR